MIGPTLRKIVVARFTRTLGTLLVVRRADPRRARHLREDRRQQGRRARHHHARATRSPKVTTWPARSPSRKVFPTMVVQMIGVGEQTGAMDQMLQKIADFYEEEVDAAVAGADLADRAGHDGVPRRRRRRPDHRDVPADLQARRQHQRVTDERRALHRATRSSGRPAGAIAAADQRRRVARLLLLRTLVDHGRARAVGVAARRAARRARAAAVWLQSSMIAATYVSSIVFGVLLRRGVAPHRVARPMLANDLVADVAARLRHRRRAEPVHVPVRAVDRRGRRARVPARRGRRDRRRRSAR